MKRNVYINKKTDAALSKLGGANRAENVRRAVALAECADELAEALEVMKADYQSAKDEWDAGNQEYAEGVISEAKAALSNYRSAKQ